MKLIPDALPISCGATALKTAVGTVGSAIESPTPAIRRAIASSIQLVAREPRQATQVKPNVCRESPTTMIGRRPIRSERAPASGDTNAEVEGPEAALELLDQLPLDNYRYFHSTRADFLRRLGRDSEA